MKVAFESKVFSRNKTLNVAGRLVDLSTAKVMGVLNVTPDSFYLGSRFITEASVAKQAEKILSEGATFIDIGGYSSRPGAQDVPVEEELKRSVLAVKTIINQFPAAIISIDTFRAEVASACLQEGAGLINDISGGELDPTMLDLVVRVQVPYVLMHMRGKPQTMKEFTTYQNLLPEIMDYFHQKIHRLQQLGIKDVIIDPGFGFAKTIDQNFEILQNLESFSIFEKPILAGLSRKSMIWKSLTLQPEQALNGTTVLNTVALLKGANILRVHDVKEAMQAITLLEKM